MGYEHEVVHPAAAKWLEKHGYTYHHEYDCGDGRIDFLASRFDGSKLIIECKGSGYGIQSAIMQVLFYQRIMGDAYQPAICLPLHAVRTHIVQKLERLSIVLITVDAPLKIVQVHQPNPISMLNTVAMFVIAWHDLHNTGHYSDIFELVSRACVRFADHADELRQWYAEYLISQVERGVEYATPIASWFDSDEFKLISKS